MGSGGGWDPLSDCPVKDAKSAMIVGAKGTLHPSAEEVIFPVEEIHFVHEIFCEMLVEGGMGWLAEWWELGPT